MSRLQAASATETIISIMLGFVILFLNWMHRSRHFFNAIVFDILDAALRRLAAKHFAL